MHAKGWEMEAGAGGEGTQPSWTAIHIEGGCVLNAVVKLSASLLDRDREDGRRAWKGAGHPTNN